MDKVSAASHEPNDAELISRVRGGDVDAYGILFSRHVQAATRFARQLVPGPDADDLVSDAFVKVLNVIRNGGGPDVAFRAYLLTAVRRLHVDRIRRTQKATPAGDLTPYDPGVPFQDTTIAGFEGGAAAKAFASLPERWQLVLWHLEVEGQKPAEIAPLLGMSANSVSALAYRAREGLRQAFLQMHTADLVGEECRWTHAQLGAYVRNSLSRRDAVKVEEHLDSCRTCSAICLELTEVNSSLAELLGPLVLGGAATAYVSSGNGGAAMTGGLGVLVGRAGDVVLANTAASVAAGATAGIVGVAALGVWAGTDHGRPDRPVADSRPMHATAHGNQATRTTPTPGQPGSTTKTQRSQQSQPSQASTQKLGQQPGEAGGAQVPVPGQPNVSNPTPATSTPTSPSRMPTSTRTADVAVNAVVVKRLARAHVVLAMVQGTVTGLPGQRVTHLLVSTTGGLTFQNQVCSPTGPSSVDCRVTPASGPVDLLVGNVSGKGTVLFKVVPVAGYADPNQANNAKTLQLSPED
ncbi:MAG: sigma-70 family RNA polymerase sigma factor [Actinomycetota bacterium]|nr:sigma-70 family RNA polymerase sigma factor [Actinomycetota bacterium]